MKRVLFLIVMIFNLAFSEEIYATFDVEGIKSSKLTLSVSGVVESLHVKIADSVKKGDLLLSLDVAEADAEVAQAKIQLELAKISLEQAKSHYDRYQKLQNVIDKERFENIDFEYQKALQSYENAKKSLKLKEVKKAKRELYAPYDGVVSDLHVELGDGVSGPSQPLVSFITKEVKLILSFDEKYWNIVKKGQKFFYRVDGLDKNFEGKIDKIYPSIDPKSRKLKAEVLSSDIPTGLFGDGKIVTE